MSGQERPRPRPVEVSVLVDDEHLASIDAVAGALRSAGLRVSGVLAAAGVIAGTADDPARIAAFERVTGVDAVEVARTIQLPPPDSPIQ